MCRALAYIHTLGICHRDVKPQNMLVDHKNGHVLKLCDFGSAKKIISGEPNIAYICSRYYRAPELILGATMYEGKVDVWALGCVVAEMILTQPLFPGESSVDQLVEIVKVLGTPTRKQILKMNPEAIDVEMPQVKKMPWTKGLFQLFGEDVDPNAVDLIEKFLKYDPKERIDPFEALLHPFFNELKNQNSRINYKPLPDLHNFTKEEIQKYPKTVAKLKDQFLTQ